MSAVPSTVTIPPGQTDGIWTMSWSVPGYTAVDLYTSNNGSPLQFAGSYAPNYSSTWGAGVAGTSNWVFRYGNFVIPASTTIASAERARFPAIGSLCGEGRVECFHSSA